MTPFWTIPHSLWLRPLRHLSPQLGPVRGAESLAQLSESAENHPPSWPAWASASCQSQGLQYQDPVLTHQARQLCLPPRPPVPYPRDFALFILSSAKAAPK